MNYSIIKDLDKLKEFVNWLQELKSNEKYYVCLFARKKYFKGLKSDKTSVKRFVTDKERMLDKIRQLECVVGSYKFGDLEIPQESLSLYINPNPRNLRKATFELQHNLISIIEKDNEYNIHAEVLNCIGESKSKTRFVDFDIDSKNIDLTKICEIVGEDNYSVVETRGGYHVLVKVFNKVKNKNWFQDITNTYNVDQEGDQLLPVPGCVQGDFIPFFLKK